MIRIITFIFVLAAWQSSKAQTISKLTITDNLAASSKFGYGKPKPAEPKDEFVMIEDKGTQVLFYADVTPSESLPDAYKLVFTAYKMSSGKDEWVDERLLDVKKTSTYALTAVNFFDTGTYKIVITNNNDKEKILAEGNFKILKN
ncbi:MAG TPA: hypothetical protein PKJ62_05240 [Bacteroidia bacterium]|nr:hypothetical protein [Bacteroidia bacterium]HNS11120.1 hypothetical protein [Bacteroidia bacterium]